MSAAIRQWVCEQLVFTDDLQKADLLDESRTSTELIEFLRQILTIRAGVWANGKLEVLAVRGDHPTFDGPAGHSGGNAIDFAPIVDDADLHLFEDLGNCPQAKGIGLGGIYQKYSSTPRSFCDNASDHIHVQVLNF
jgi:hypothetical protein